MIVTRVFSVKDNTTVDIGNCLIGKSENKIRETWGLHEAPRTSLEIIRSRANTFENSQADVGVSDSLIPGITCKYELRCLHLPIY